MSVAHEAVFDARWLRTGIGRYILTLLRELRPRLQAEDVNARLTCITLSGQTETVAPYCDRVVQLDCGIYSVMEQARLPMIARGASVFCAPHYNVPIFHQGPLVVTIHDLTHLLFPAYGRSLRARVYAEPVLRLACSRASHIVVPSRYTKMTLVRRLHADARKISVIPGVVDTAFHPRDRQDAERRVRVSFGVSAPYLLFVGSTAAHKNLAGLLRAYRQLRARYRDMPLLVLVLPHPSSASATDKGLRVLMNTPGVLCLHSVTDQSLASLYSAALMTVMPSFEEGFGLPVMESMANGTPVVCSSAASLPEIAGGDAVYFSPDSAEEIAAAIELLLHSEELRHRLADAGLKRAAQYSAGRAASSYASVLSSIFLQQNA